MFGKMAQISWFASTLRVPWRILHPADVSRSFLDYALCPELGSSANGVFSCMVAIRHLLAVCVRYEKATGQFNKAHRRLQRKASKKQMITRPGTLEFAKYVIV